MTTQTTAQQPKITKQIIKYIIINNLGQFHGRIGGWDSTPYGNFVAKFTEVGDAWRYIEDRFTDEEIELLNIKPSQQQFTQTTLYY